MPKPQKTPTLVMYGVTLGSTETDLAGQGAKLIRRQLVDNLHRLHYASVSGEEKAGRHSVRARGGHVDGQSFTSTYLDLEEVKERGREPRAMGTTWAGAVKSGLEGCSTDCIRGGGGCWASGGGNGGSGRAPAKDRAESAATGGLLPSTGCLSASAAAGAVGCSTFSLSTGTSGFSVVVFGPGLNAGLVIFGFRFNAASSSGSSSSSSASRTIRARRGNNSKCTDLTVGKQVRMEQ
ncbi:hypothetical protein TYRP_018353 [Tyrophagus putrescentiae]|nr:hypothetical protein TYRP_018353 [Tyrophagus putrescentiae]